MSTNLWVDDYRPSKIEDIILPERFKLLFQNMIENKKIPNLLLSGDAGIGKTTVAMALCEELNLDYLLVNGSLEGNIDILRTRLENFVVSKSLIGNGGNTKAIIFDEADQISLAAQGALRGFIEKHQTHVRFIFTCNFKNQIIEAIWSRCKEVVFSLEPEDKKPMAMGFMKATLGILEQENITYDKKVIGQIIKDKFPDFRSIINELDAYAIGGNIDEGILSTRNNLVIGDVVEFLKNKDWQAMRSWVDENQNMHTGSFVSTLWRNVDEYFPPSSQPILIDILDDYQRWIGSVPDPLITLTATLTKIMANVDFK